MEENNEGQPNVNQTSRNVRILITSTQKENTSRPQEIARDSKTKKQKWSDLELQDRAIIMLTFGILLITGYTCSVFIQQAKIMQGQLDSMATSEQQTERLIILSTGQLVQAARSAIAAGNEASAAKTSATNSSKSVQATQDATRLDQRAWVTLHGIGGNEAIPTLNQPWNINTFFVDTGKTPAIHFQLSCNWDIKPTEAEIVFKQAPYERPTLLAPGDLSTGCVISPLGINAKVGPDLLNAISSGKDTLFVFGHVIYDDVFNKPHWLKFCLSRHPEGNAWDACKAHDNDTGDGKYKE